MASIALFAMVAVGANGQHSGVPGPVRLLLAWQL
jgi:hypothetical protein